MKFYKDSDNVYWLNGMTLPAGTYILDPSDDETSVSLYPYDMDTHPNLPAIYNKPVIEFQDETGTPYIDYTAFYAAVAGFFVNASGDGGGTPATTFVGLTDTPSNYVGRAGNIVTVSGTEDSLLFTAASIPSTFTDLTDTPINYTGQAGNKVVVNSTEDGLEFAGSTTVQGIEDPENVTITFDDITRRLTLTAVSDTFKLVTSDGTSYEKASDFVDLPAVEGFHLIYYDDSDGVLKSLNSLNRNQIYDTLKVNIAVSVVEYSLLDTRNNFTTVILKGRDMNNTTWLKNAFDKDIYGLQGFSLFDDPSVGGTVTPPDNLDTSAQFGISEGVSLWTDSKYDVNIRNTGDNWNVYYDDGGDLRYITKTGFACLQDTDFALTTTGRLVYNDGGIPTAVGTNNFVWYFIGTSNDKDQSKRLVSFMGQGEYGNINAARNSVLEEATATVNIFGIRQEFTTLYGILYQSGSYSNSVQAVIRDVYTVRDELGAVGSTPIPSELVDGSDASTLHNHNSLYAKLPLTQSFTPSALDVAWSSNTDYLYALTVPGASVNDPVIINTNEALWSATNGTNLNMTVFTQSADTVYIRVRTTSYVALNGTHLLYVTVFPTV